MAALDAAGLVGLLADVHRRRVVAAIELGATHVDDVITATGLSGAQVAKALGRLVEGGLVVQSDAGLTIDAGAFQRAARDANQRPATTEDFGDVSEAQRKVLSAFVSGGRLTSIPVSPAKRTVILDWLAQDFEPGRRYSEQMVNLIIGQRHADTAALRRYLVDGGFLDRSSGEYWRSGGTVSE
jgi:hypothetical protein